jgi:hypothetical protein
VSMRMMQVRSHEVADDRRPTRHCCTR